MGGAGSSELIMFGMLIGYKILVLVGGLLMAFMGYRLFLADKVAAAGDLSGNIKDYALSLKGGAPGVFFSFFGCVLICFSIFKGVEYRTQAAAPPSQSVPATDGKSLLIIPDEPPV